jgi:hypothetical protein
MNSNPSCTVRDTVSLLDEPQDHFTTATPTSKPAAGDVVVAGVVPAAAARFAAQEGPVAAPGLAAVEAPGVLVGAGEAGGVVPAAAARLAAQDGWAGDATVPGEEGVVVPDGGLGKKLRGAVEVAGAAAAWQLWGWGWVGAYTESEVNSHSGQRTIRNTRP